jgi:hypothetical protein
MKKRLLTSLLIGVVVAGGIIAGRAFANRSTKRTSWPAVTIVLQQTEYGLQGEILRSVKIVRHQHSDGRWEQRMDDRGDGKPSHSRGQIDPSTAPTAEEYARASVEVGRQETELLGYRVFIQRNPREELWIAPDLDAILKGVSYYEDGSVSDVTEAILITPGKPN